MRALALHRVLALALAGGLFLGTGCSAVSSAMGDVTGSSRKKEEAALVERVQGQLMTYADVYAGEVLATTSSIPARTADEQLFVVGFQVRQATAAYEIASGTSPYAGVLDMVVLVSLTRWSVDVYEAPWMGKGALDPLRRSLATLEPRIWSLAEEFLQPDQEKKLRAFIEAWYRRPRNSARANGR